MNIMCRIEVRVFVSQDSDPSSIPQLTQIIWKIVTSRWCDLDNIDFVIEGSHH